MKLFNFKNELDIFIIKLNFFLTETHRNFYSLICTKNVSNKNNTKTFNIEK
jgi:hypothetical protein